MKRNEKKRNKSNKFLYDIYIDTNARTLLKKHRIKQKRKILKSLYISNIKYKNTKTRFVEKQETNRNETIQIRCIIVETREIEYIDPLEAILRQRERIGTIKTNFIPLREEISTMKGLLLTLSKIELNDIPLYPDFISKIFVIEQ